MHAKWCVAASTVVSLTSSDSTRAVLSGEGKCVGHKQPPSSFHFETSSPVSACSPQSGSVGSDYGGVSDRLALAIDAPTLHTGHDVDRNGSEVDTVVRAAIGAGSLASWNGHRIRTLRCSLAPNRVADFNPHSLTVLPLKAEFTIVGSPRCGG